MVASTSKSSRPGGTTPASLAAMGTSIEQIEIKIAYLEQANAELSDVVYEQRQELSRCVRNCRNYYVGSTLHRRQRPTRRKTKDLRTTEPRKSTERAGRVYGPARVGPSDVPWHNPRKGRSAVANSRWLSATLVALAASAEAQEIRPAPAFAGADLVPAPMAGWPTNGGNWYNQRYSPLSEINRSNVPS